MTREARPSVLEVSRWVPLAPPVLIDLGHSIADTGQASGTPLWPPLQGGLAVSKKEHADKTDKAPADSDELAAGQRGTSDQKMHSKGISRREYERRLAQLQVELAKLQHWIVHQKMKVVIVFEGRDAAGKGGTIKRITECLNPRVCRVVALPAPTERAETQWYFQRYAAHLPAAGEMVIFDRSWYNRAGVERVMGYCTEDQYQEFLRSCPEFERMLVRAGIQLIKYWFSVSNEEQERRFQRRIQDPTKRWKLSPMDLESRERWVEYSRAKDAMFAVTDIKQAPWYVVPSDSKKSARLNCISHLLSLFNYEDLTPEPFELPPRGSTTAMSGRRSRTSASFRRSTNSRECSRAIIGRTDLMASGDSAQNPLARPPERELLDQFRALSGLRGEADPQHQLGGLVRAFAAVPYENLTKIVKYAECHVPAAARRAPREVLRDFHRAAQAGLVSRSPRPCSIWCVRCGSKRSRFWLTGDTAPTRIAR